MFFHLSANLNCPDSHPFATKNGCCSKYFKENIPAVNPMCDGKAWVEKEPDECCLTENFLELTPCHKRTRMCRNGKLILPGKSREK